MLDRRQPVSNKKWETHLPGHTNIPFLVDKHTDTAASEHQASALVALSGSERAEKYKTNKECYLRVVNNDVTLRPHSHCNMGSIESQ